MNAEKPWFLKEGGISFRQWKQQKRAELRALKKALDAYRYGCAYCPGFENRDVDRVAAGIDRMRSAHSVKSWGR